MNAGNLKFISDLCKNSVDWLDFDEFYKYFTRNNFVLCWGSHNYKFYGNRVFIFQVEAVKFTGFVVIRVNGTDLFDIYYLTFKCKLFGQDNDIYLEDLISVIDDKIEYSGENYKNDAMKASQEIWSKI